MNKELSNLFLTSFNNGKIIHLLDKFKNENEDSIYNLYKGIIYLNLKDYNLASKYFYKGIKNNPSNELLYSNLKMLPSMYQRKKYIITVEGHLHTTHSFGIIFKQFLKSLRKLDYVELRLKHIPVIGIEDKFLSSNKEIMSDLTIRLCIPTNDNNKGMVYFCNSFDCSPDKNSKHTLIFVVTEGINVRFFKNLNDNVFIMTPSNYSKECFLKTHYDLSLDNRIKVIPHGIDYSSKHIFNKKQISLTRLKYGIQKEFVFLNISGNTKNKNVSKIIQAFLRLPQNNIKLIIKINSYNNNFNNKVSDIINENIIVIYENFNEEEMNELYNICDCYISASTAEGFNMTVLEAGSYGKLVICPENSPTDEFTCAKGCIKIKGIVLSSKTLNINVDDIFNAMEEATKMTIDTEVTNTIIVHHLKYNWDIIIKDLVNHYCCLNDNYNYLKELIYVNKSPNNEYYLDKYYNSLLNHNINDILYNDTMKNTFIELYLYIFSKDKHNIFKSILLSFPTTLLESLYFSIKTDKILNIIAYLNSSKLEHEFIKNSISTHLLENYICLLPELYFLSSYLSNDISKKVKYSINCRIQTMWENNNIVVSNQPIKIKDKYKLCIITNSKNLICNVVYKFIKNHIKILSELFYIDVYLLDNIVTSIKETQQVIEKALDIKINRLSSIIFSTDINFFYKLYSNNFKDNNDIYNYITNFDTLLNNDYLCCYIPVLGCEISSIYLSNLQIAPIQFGSYAHPISSFGSKNNYFIASNDIEKKEYITNNYSEKIINVKGLTTMPIYNTFKDYNIKEKQDTTILISSNFKKITPYFRETIETICKKYYLTYKKKIFIKIFPGHSRKYNYTDESCNKCFNSNYYNYEFLYIPDCDVYMKEKYKCKVCFDGYPYGGFTTLLENIKLHIPCIVYEGNEAINNFASYIYRFFNLEELIVYSFEEYIELGYRLLTDERFYNDIYIKLKSTDLSLLKKINIKDSMLASFNELIQEYEESANVKNI
jgi:hypothetical protein